MASESSNIQIKLEHKRRLLERERAERQCVVFPGSAGSSGAAHLSTVRQSKAANTSNVEAPASFAYFNVEW